MLNKQLHKNILTSVLKDVYADPDIRTILGFKGGTAALLFYNLPRFSVDLYFDLLDESKKELVLQEVGNILKKYGTLEQATEKRFTLFFFSNIKKENVI